MSSVRSDCFLCEQEPTMHSRPFLGRFFCAISWLLLGLESSAAKGQIEWSGQTMGTIGYSVKLDSLPAGLSRESAQALVDRELDLVNRLMSTYRDDSDVSRFNHSPASDWFPVAPETRDVVARALEFSQLTGGAFDVTVAPLVNLWHFGPEAGDRQALPSQEKIDAARNRVGFEKLHVQADPPALKKDDPALWVDLSAIAKGYAVDRVVNALWSAGARNFLVEVGGEVAVRGRKSPSVAWRIGIVWPVDDQLAMRDAAELADQAMATSGDYRNFTIVDGKRYSHTIDPQTGRPVTNDLASASVIAPDCMSADAMATAVMVLGRERGGELCAKLGYPLLAYQREGERFALARSDDFPLVSANPVPAGNGLSIFIGSAVIFGLVVLAMAVGVIFGNLRISGSCGGLANVKDEHGNVSCGLCTRPASECRDVKRWLTKPAMRDEPQQADFDHSN